MFPMFLTLFLFLLCVVQTHQDERDTCLVHFHKIQGDVLYTDAAQRYNQSVARNVSLECQNVEKCPKNRTDLAGIREMLNDWCEIAELYEGPLGACIDTLKKKDGKMKLINCTLDSIDYNNITKDTPWFGPNDTRKDLEEVLLYGHAFCQSIFHPCTTAMITENCEPGVLEILDENRDVLERANCVGMQIYKPYTWGIFADGRATENVDRLLEDYKYGDDYEETDLELEESEIEVPISNNDTDCYYLEEDFMMNLLFPMGPLDSSVVQECYRVAEKCPSDPEILEYERFTGDTPFDDKYCPMLDLYVGEKFQNVRECFLKLQKEPNKFSLMNCTWNSINFNVITNSTPWTGPNDPRPEFKRTEEEYYLWKPSCQSIFQKYNCTSSMIRSICDSEVLDVLQKNREILEDGYCTGIEIYNNVEWNMFVLRELEGLKNRRVISDGSDDK